MNKMRILLTLTIALFAFININAQDYIKPLMVNIPSGSFMMGSENGDDSTKPIHNVSVTAFQLAKYPVTVAEYRKFIEETNYKPASNCSDYLDQNWFSDEEESDANWEKHRFSYSDYQPVTCITFKDVNAYVTWLNKKTGIQYRLPTEEEWEYAAKGNTSSRYFWGDDTNMTQAHLYANYADHSSEYFASKDFGASYVGFIGHSNGNDNEPYNAIVGLYRPNPFGLYDMVGNVSQFLSTCYREDGYKKSSKEEKETSKCEFISHRGGTWHNPPQPIWVRGSYKVGSTPGVTTGFRLAIDGHSSKNDVLTTSFEKELKKAQLNRLEFRPKLIAAPKNVQLIKLKDSTYTLSWQLNKDPKVMAYVIYQSNNNKAHLLGQFYKNYYQKIEEIDANKNSVQVVPSKYGNSFRVVAKTRDISSLPSNPVTISKEKALLIPGEITMDNSIELENVNLWYRKSRKNKPELYYLSKVNKNFERSLVTSTFRIDVKEPGWYKLNYRGSSFQKGVFFKIWQNNKLLGEIGFDSKIDDKTSNRHKIYLEKGRQELQLTFKRTGFDYWNMVWVKFSKV